MLIEVKRHASFSPHGVLVMTHPCSIDSHGAGATSTMLVLGKGILSTFIWFRNQTPLLDGVLYLLA